MIIAFDHDITYNFRVVVVVESAAAAVDYLFTRRFA